MFISPFKAYEDFDMSRSIKYAHTRVSIQFLWNPLFCRFISGPHTASKGLKSVAVWNVWGWYSEYKRVV